MSNKTQNYKITKLQLGRPNNITRTVVDRRIMNLGTSVVTLQYYNTRIHNVIMYIF